MGNDYFETRERLRKQYIAPKEISKAKGEQLGGTGFLTEVAGRVILTAPASMLTDAGQLPKELAERWEKAAGGHPYMTWLQGRYVEAEKANRNGAFWSTEDLQFGEMSVKHGPLNWLHEERTVIGTIADNALIRPEPIQQQAMQLTVPNHTQQLVTSTSTNLTVQPGTVTTANIFSTAMPRPYMAAVSAMWNWVHPDRVEAVERAADTGKLWYSMECVGREMSCVSDETHEGCGKSFDYVTAMTQPGKTCEHMQGRTSARRIVDPAFLGGAVIVPPAAPGWGAANVELLRSSASLAEQTFQTSAEMTAGEWEQLIAHVVRFATH
jgi:hypothetical protein